MCEGQTYYDWVANRETWSVWNWITNNPAQNRYWETMARHHLSQHPKSIGVAEDCWAVETLSLGHFAVKLKNAITQSLTKKQRSLADDLVSCSLEHVDWSDIAADLLIRHSDDYRETVPCGRNQGPRLTPRNIEVPPLLVESRRK